STMFRSLFTRFRRRPARRPSARLCCEPLEDRLLLTNYYVVTTTSGDNVPGSLTQAILEANAHPGPDEIDFTITTDSNFPGVHTTQLSKPLPEVTDPVIIDGTTQPEYLTAGHPVVELDCNLQVIGLSLFADGSTVRGLAINRFKTAGISVQSDNNKIEGN